MERKNHLLPTEEVTRINYQKRHSLSTLLLTTDIVKPKRPNSSLGLPRLRSRTNGDEKTVSSLFFRVVLIGSKGVGKTSIIHRYLSDTYTDTYRPTVSDIYEKNITRGEDETLNTLKMYDTAGDLQFEFPAMFSLTVTEGDMFVLIYSVENRRSFDSIENLWQKILENKEKQEGEVPMVLVGNKSDVSATRRKVSKDEGRQLARKMNCPFFEVSAKIGFDVSSVYNTLLMERDKIEQPERGKRCFDFKEQDVGDSVFKGDDTDTHQGKEKERRHMQMQRRPNGLKRKGSSCLLM